MVALNYDLSFLCIFQHNPKTYRFKFNFCIYIYLPTARPTYEGKRLGTQKFYLELTQICLLENVSDGSLRDIEKNWRCVLQILNGCLLKKFNSQFL